MRLIHPWRSALFGLTALVALAVLSDAQQPFLSQGPYSKMQMVLTRTFLKVRAAQVVVRYGEATREALRDIVAGQQYSDKIADRVASEALSMRGFALEMRFLRDVGFGEFVSGTRDNVQCAADSKLIDEHEYQRVADGTPRWFEPVAKRGFKEGDRIVYVNQGDTLWTFVRSNGGELLVRRVERGPDPPRTLLASFFAPCSDFREELVRSLFEPWQGA